MDAELERFVDQASDPRLISGIYNYCHRRCERCPFTERCLTFRHMRDEAASAPERSAVESVGHSLALAFDLLVHWGEREGLDMQSLREEASSQVAEAERAQFDRDLESDSLHSQAFAYAQAAFALVSALRGMAPFYEWSPVVGEALETIGWYAGMIGAKVDRSLRGVAIRQTLGAAEDPVQNDWNGSAKAARLAIADSRRAWDTLLLVGQAPADARLRETRELLDRIDEGLACRFPRAMDFVRPGFDEPDVAAGAVSHLECYEPRRPRRGVVAWLHRVAGAWQRRS